MASLLAQIEAAQCAEARVALLRQHEQLLRGMWISFIVAEGAQSAVVVMPARSRRRRKLLATAPYRGGWEGSVGIFVVARERVARWLATAATKHHLQAAPLEALVVVCLDDWGASVWWSPNDLGSGSVVVGLRQDTRHEGTVARARRRTGLPSEPSND